jgi:serine/threonine protein kinase
MDRDRDTGLPLTALREIKLLSGSFLASSSTLPPSACACVRLSFAILSTVLNHHNIVKLKGIAVDTSWDEIFLVFEYIEHDLAELIDNVIRTKPFSISEVKSLLYQLLSAVGHMHNHWIIHRDIKVCPSRFSSHVP